MFPAYHGSLNVPGRVHGTWHGGQKNLVELLVQESEKYVTSPPVD